jgi:modulator of FtsH protease HflC
MNRNNLVWASLIVAVFLVVLLNTVYTVGQTEQAIVLRFGEPVRIVNAPSTNDTPGLKVKIPFLERALKFDKRNLQLEPQEAEIIGRDQNRLVVDAFVRYRISDPLQFYRGLRNVATAEDRLRSMVSSALREQLGQATIEEIVSSQRAPLMIRTRDEVARRARASRFGIEIIDLRIKRADFPTANETSVYTRMRTARQQQAAQYRAQGEQQKLEIVGGATKQAEQIRGEADAERARIFADSFGKDPSFAAFYRSMAAYEASMGQNGETTMVLSPDSEFFRYFSGGPGSSGK